MNIYTVYHKKTTFSLSLMSESNTRDNSTGDIIFARMAQTTQKLLEIIKLARQAQEAENEAVKGSLNKFNQHRTDTSDEASQLKSFPRLSLKHNNFKAWNSSLIDFVSLINGVIDEKQTDFVYGTSGSFRDFMSKDDLAIHEKVMNILLESISPDLMVFIDTKGGILSLYKQLKSAVREKVAVTSSFKELNDSKLRYRRRSIRT